MPTQTDQQRNRTEPKHYSKQANNGFRNLAKKITENKKLKKILFGIRIWLNLEIKIQNS